MLEQFSHTVQKVYGAAVGDTSWEDALVAIEDLTGSAGAVIDLVPRSEAVDARTLAGSFTQENCAEYANEYQAICPRIRYAMEQPASATHYDYLFMTEAAMDRDPVYSWFGRHGLRYYLACSVGETPNYLTYFSLQRTRRQGHAQPVNIEQFDLLKPHISRAVSLADQLGTFRSYRRFASALLDALPQALLALDGKANLLFANASARALLEAGDGLTIENGRLKTAHPGEQGLVEAALRSAINPEISVAGGWARVSRPSKRRPYALFAAPLVLTDEDLHAATAKILVIVHDRASLGQADGEMLKAVYGLTDAEARLASAISGGHSLESASAVLRIQPSTARAQLKAVFRKVEVNRQQDLVRALIAL